MYKIWAKLLNEDRKMVKDAIISREGTFDESLFFDDLIELCKKLDVATPCVLRYHVESLEKFSYLKFLPRDFLEEVPFSAMTLEYAYVEERNKNKK